MKKTLSILALCILSITAYADEIELNKPVAGVVNEKNCTGNITYSLPNPEHVEAFMVKLSMIGGVNGLGNDIGFFYRSMGGGYNKILPNLPTRIAANWDQVSEDVLNFEIANQACNSGRRTPYELMVTKLPDMVSITGTLKIYESVTDPVTGNVKMTRLAITEANLSDQDKAVNIYDEVGNFVKSAGIDVTRDASGVGYQYVYGVQLPKGRYSIAASNGAVTTWNTGSPRVRASAFEISRDTVKDLSIYSTIPHIDTVSTAVMTKGQPITINGTGFGTSKGYVEFGSYVTNSKIALWSDTAITMAVPTSAIPGCLRVFAKYAAGSNCMDIQ